MKKKFSGLDIYHHEMEKFFSQCETCYLYGTGETAKMLLTFIKKEKMSIAGFIVSKKENDFFCGYPVFDVRNVRLDVKKDSIILAVGENIQADIEKEIYQHIGPIRIYAQKMFYRKMEIPTKNKEELEDYTGYFSVFQKLDYLGKENKTDKCSLEHNYLNKYEFFLNRFTDREFNLLELGVYHGSSIKMWGEYFPKAHVYGADVDELCKKYEAGNRKVLITDLSDADNILELSKLDPSIIIDDASHYWSHQIKALFLLFDTLPHGGIYIMEDIETSFLNAGFIGFNDAKISAYDVCSLIAEVATSHESLRDKTIFSQEIEQIGKNVEMISFIEGSCIIIKR